MPPGAGAVIVTVGAPLTLIVTVALSVLPPASVTLAVIVCVPDWSVLTVTLAPVPRLPSRSELQAMVALRSFSSGSVAVPVKATVSPGLKTLAGAGAVIVTVGAPLTLIVTVALSVLPPASVTIAVMTWVPDWSVLTVKLAPVPRLPSRSELQAIAALRSVSSGSVAVPVKVTVSPGLKTLAGAGAVIVTLGAPLTVIVTVALSVLPPASVMLAVMVWVPDWSVPTVKLAPVPRLPSRSELQAIAALRSVSSGSVAVPVKVAVSPGLKTLAGAGAVIVTLGAPLTVIVTVALSVLPPASVMLAVMVWVPDWSVPTVKLAPVPRLPSRSELQAIAALRSVSSGAVGGA